MVTSKGRSGGIKNFFLLNVEKLILGVSLALLGLFFYMGMSSEKFDKTPDKLVAQSNQATSYIESNNAWDKIADFRQGDVKVIDRVKRADAPVDPTPYRIAGLSMVPKALGLRLDPPLPEVKDIEASVLRATVILRNTQRGREDPILRLPIAMAKSDADATMLQSTDEMEMDEQDVGLGRALRRRGRENDRDPQLEAEVDGGSGLPVSQVAMQGGIRLDSLSSDDNMALKRNIVVVNALVDHKTLWKLQEKTLSSTLGYFPIRDLPRYEYLQVEKREIKAGQPGEWSDISTFVNFDQAGLYPASFTSAPEVVPPESYDPAITNAIPPIVGVDYASLVLHSKLQKRVFKVPEELNQGVAASALLEGTEQMRDPDNVMSNPDGTGIRRQKAGIGVIGGNQSNNMQMGMDGMQGNYGSGTRNIGDGRSSSDLTEYIRLSNPTLEPISDFKQIRFFDMSVPTNKNAVFEYRIRLWVADPNHTDGQGMPQLDQFAQNDAMDAGMGMGGPRIGQGKDEDEKKIYEKTEINFTMQDQSVRNRIKRAREVGELGAKEYFVSEIYEGEEEPTEIKVPKGEEYLRYARPTKWSAPVKVTVGGGSSEFYAQGIAEQRKSKVGSFEIPVEEPKAEIVTAIEDPAYQGATIAAKRLAATGDLLNYSEPITVMHPVTQSIHFVEEMDIRSNGVVLDIMGGDSLDMPQVEGMNYDLPGETLVMSKDGKFVVSNDMEDVEESRHALRLPDQSNRIGGKKAAKRRKREMEDAEGGGRRGRR